MTDEAKALVERLRDDLPQTLIEKHWVDDHDAIYKQREEAADLIEALEMQLESANEALRERLDICEIQAREIERLREALGFSMRTLEAEGFSDDGPTLTRIRAALAGDSHD